MLQDGDETLLTFQALDQPGYRIQAGQGMQRAAVMTGRKVGGTCHRQGRGRQHRLSRCSGSEFLQCTIQDFGWGCFLDELD